MKKALKVILIVVVIFLALLIVLPFAFKGKIVSAVKEAANENLNAKLEFSDLNLSFLRSFPHLSVKLKNLSIEGVEPFQSDTLVAVPDFAISINLMSVLRGDKYEVRTVSIDNARVFLKVLADGRANWDIVKQDTTAVSDTTETVSDFEVSLKRLSLSNAFLIYDDASLNTFVRAEGLNHTLTGDLSASSTELDTRTAIDLLLVNYEGVRYLNRANVSLDSKINADLDNYIFTFPDARLKVNELNLLAKGFFAMPEEGYDMDIQFEALENDFRNFLSLVPAVYAKDFDQVKASGTLAFNGFVKGLYTDNTMPAFGLNLDIDNGRFQYPDLPGAVENIMLKAVIDNKTGVPDATAIDVTTFHMEMMGNPIDARLSVRTPVSDPYLDAFVKGTINLNDVNKIYPLEEGDQLAGMIVADFAVKGNQSAAEAQRYNEFQASGELNISDLVYNTTAFDAPIRIAKALFTLSPAAITMPEMNLLMGDNDIAASGQITNYLAYAFDKGELRGNLNMHSNYLNLNDFMEEDTEQVSDTTASTMSVIEVPADIDFQMNSTFNKILYDDLELTNASGTLRLKDQQLMLQNLRFNTLQGEMTMNGTYSTLNPQQPEVKMTLDVRRVDVQEAFNNFMTVEKLAPIAKLTSGKISSSFNFNTLLGMDMMPLLNSLNGSGNLTSPALVINNVNVFNKLADALKIEQFKRWAIDNINLSFEIEDGRVFVKPFNTKLGNINAEISGWNSFDQTLEYVMELAIPRSTFGGAANNVLDNLVSQANAKGANFSVGSTVPVSVLISGTVDDPKISTSLQSMGTNLMEGLKETIDQKKEEVVTKVREEATKYIEEANVQAQKLLDAAQVQADKIMSTANQTAQTIRNEADNQAKQVIAEGKKKGMVGELAANKAAETIRSEGDKRATDVVNEAQKQADGIISTARQQADKLKADAQKKAAGE